MSTFTIGWQQCGTTYYHFDGAQGSPALATILRDGKHFLDTRCYVARLSPRNNKLQDATVRRQCPWKVIEHDAELSEALLDEPTRYLLDALRLKASTEAVAA